MTPVVRLACFGAAVLLAGTTSFGLGRAWFRSDPADAVGHQTHKPTPSSGHAQHGSAVLRQLSPAVKQGTQDFRFVLERDGARLTEFEVRHDRELHFIVVRRDLTGFRHLHPERQADGSWSVALTLDSPGPYRVYADFAVKGEDPQAAPLDVLAPGDYVPRTTTAERRHASAGTDLVETKGALTPGRESTLAFDMTHGGRPVTDLEPYLGSQAHLVLLRIEDLSYLHVHPEGEELAFAAKVPAAGLYAAYLETKRAGVVRTSSLVLRAK